MRKNASEPSKRGRPDPLETLFSTYSPDETAPYREIAAFLRELGYKPRKLRGGYNFICDAHPKQLAKLASVRTKGADRLTFSLRFSACRAPSERFQKIASDFIAKYPTRAARCPEGACGFCAGPPEAHAYRVAGSSRLLCGAYALPIPDFSESDLEEAKRLILEEDAYWRGKR